ncbi:MAG: hypothetical protein OIF32_12500 [Campylobacterales bacterium]|nr:hypothetical protein [Campylobacterales bacterium]
MVLDTLLGYSDKTHMLPSPSPNTGYISAQKALTAHSRYVHPMFEVLDEYASPVMINQTGLLMDVVHYDNSKEWMTIMEGSLLEIDSGLNERIIDNGLTVSPYLLRTDIYSGYKVKRYYIPDITNDTKRIKITTCPIGVDPRTNQIEWWEPTEEKCRFTITYIHGTAPSRVVNP